MVLGSDPMTKLSCVLPVKEWTFGEFIWTVLVKSSHSIQKFQNNILKIFLIKIKFYNMLLNLSKFEDLTGKNVDTKVQAMIRHIFTACLKFATG